MGGQLWLLRHGEAEPHGARPDEQRALTERGERQARAAGAALAALGVRLDAIVASPRVRALDTARLACEELGAGLAPQAHAALSAGFEASQAIALLAGCGEGSHLLLVGHEPDLSGLVHALTGARIKLKKGGLAVVGLDAPGASARGGGSPQRDGGSPQRGGAPPPVGELMLLARPRELALIAGMARSEV
jgi:phosphohistidine phosphatase